MKKRNLQIEHLQNFKQNVLRVFETGMMCFERQKMNVN